MVNPSASERPDKHIAELYDDGGGIDHKADDGIFTTRVDINFYREDVELFGAYLEGVADALITSITVIKNPLWKPGEAPGLLVRRIGWEWQMQKTHCRQAGVAGRP
jgi:hypothetical protein